MVRINRDYTDGPPGGPGGPGGAGGAGGAGAPPVTVVPLHTLKGGGGLRAVEGLLLSEEFRRAPRLVLQGAPGDLLKETRSGFRVNSRQNLEGWAQDSVGLFAPYEVEVGRYSALPGMGEGKGLARPGVAQGLLHVRLCDQVHSPNLGNRSCFDKCD
ncbi:hypothetical protein B484DRAFT_400954 [Ochromonadaceae sp. CCMP2298]|nr:hypothetical protein B484DRAFT_400954 [Ochromonadaceae sp. CCMP2298]